MEAEAVELGLSGRCLIRANEFSSSFKLQLIMSLGTHTHAHTHRLRKVGGKEKMMAGKEIDHNLS